MNDSVLLPKDEEVVGKPVTASRGAVALSGGTTVSNGADAMRTFLLFIGPWDQGGPWNPQGFEGIPRFLNRVWAVVTDAPEASGAASVDRACPKDVRKGRPPSFDRETSDRRLRRSARVARRERYAASGGGR